MAARTVARAGVGVPAPRARKRTWLGVPRYVIACLAAVISMTPFVFMVSASFKTSREFLDNPFGWPQEATMQNFFGLLTWEFLRYFVNSLVLTAVTVVVTVILGALAAYPLSRIPTKINQPITLLFLIGMMIPIHITLLPVYVFTQQMGIYDTLLALFGPYIAFSLPVTVYVLIGFFKQIPEALLDAARIDGAGHLRIFLQVVVPLAMPAISTVAIINYIFAWNEFIFALVLVSSDSNFPIPLGLNAFHGQYQVNVPGMMAALVVATLPSVLFFLAAQEKVVAGLAAGAIAGE